MQSFMFASIAITRRMQRSDGKNQYSFVKAILCVIEITPPTSLTLCLWPNYTAEKALVKARYFFFFFFPGKMGLQFEQESTETILMTSYV